MAWLETYRAETGTVIAEPFFRCLAEAVATVESDHGRQALNAREGLNEIGYKAIPGHPALHAGTREADAQGVLAPAQADFRIFRDRREQAEALLWLLRSSRYYETARLLFILGFYSAYAPGRIAGAREVVKVFNEIARTGAHEGVRPLGLLPDGQSVPEEQPDPETLRLNHAAARQAVRLFAELTSAPNHEQA